MGPHGEVCFLLSLWQMMSQGRKQEKDNASLISSTPRKPEVFEAVMQVKAISHEYLYVNANVNLLVPQAGKT